MIQTAFLIAALGLLPNDSWRVREAGSAAIKNAPMRYWPAIRYVTSKHPDPEARRRCLTVHNRMCDVWLERLETVRYTETCLPRPSNDLFFDALHLNARDPEWCFWEQAGSDWNHDLDHTCFRLWATERARRGDTATVEAQQAYARHHMNLIWGFHRYE